MAEKTYYDWLFKESDEEKGIHRLMDKERARYEGTEAYKEHAAKLDELLDELKEAGKRRREEAKKHRPRRHKQEKTVDIEAFKADIQNQRQKKLESLPEELRNLIIAYEKLDKPAKKVFRNLTYAWDPEYKDYYKDPITTEEDLRQLLEILVQTTIDFIDERGLTDIDAIGFGADGLQESAKAGQWVCSTDASIHATGLGPEKGDDGTEYLVVQKIGEYL